MKKALIENFVARMYNECADNLVPFLSFVCCNLLVDRQLPPPM